MLRAIMGAGLLTFLSTGASPQSAGDAPAFDVASVKLTQHGRDANGLSISDVKISSPGRLDRPVLDRTEIKGFFRITLEWAPEGDGPSIFSAIQEQLGLKLEASKAPIEILVIDHAQRIPTEN